MGKSSGTSTTTSTNAPPPDVTAQYDNLIAQANAQSAKPLQQYQGNIVAPLNATQQQAATDVTNAQGLAQPYLNQAQGLIQNASQPIVPQTVNAADIQQYENPYTQQVLNSTMAAENNQDAQQQQQVTGNAISQGAFGGDRSAVAAALTAGQQAIANNTTNAGIESQGYSQALGEANTQQQAALSAQEASQYLGQQGGFGLMNLGTTAENTALSGANALDTIGNQEQTQAQSELNVPYEQFEQQQAFPYQNLSWLSSLSTGLGSGEGGTSTTTQPAPNSLFARGGHVEGLIKRIATGGAVMMPAHYDSGGIIPGQTSQFNAGIPDISVGYIPGAVSLTKGSGIPQPPKPEQQPSDMQQATQAVGLAAGVNSLAGKGGISGATSGLFASPSAAPTINGAAESLGTDEGYADLYPTSIGSSGGIFSGLTDSLPSISGVGSGIADAASAAYAALPSFAELLPFAFNRGGMIKPHARGGLIKHYDDGGGVTPFDMSTNPMTNNATSQYANMSTQQLQQLLPRIQQPQQKQIVQKVLQQKMAMPNSPQTPSNAPPMAPNAPQTSMARGGLIRKFADGGSDDTDSLLQTMAGTSPSPDVTSAPDDLPSLGLMKADPSLSAQPVNISRNADAVSDDNTASAPSGLIKSPSPSSSSNGFTPVAIPSFHDDKPINDVSPWLSVLAGVARAAAGRSPYILQNLAGGVEAGLGNYTAQKKESADETYKAGSIQDARDQLVREAEQFNSTGQKQAEQFQQNLSLDQQKQSEMEKYHQAEIADQAAERKNQALQLNKPEFDKAGNPWFRDSSSPNGWTKGTENTLGADKNVYGYDIGSVPQGTTAPVIDPKYDPTIGMDVTRKSINAQKTQDQLEKDNAAAAVNNDSIVRLQAAKNVITTAPTGGLTNFFGVGPVADAFSTQRQELSALNKELAMAPGERPTNMRLTQGEVMMLKQAQPGNDKGAEANADIADANIAIRQRPAEFAQFKNDFVANNGYWNDAIGQQMYTKYVNDNPIIDVAKSGQGKIVLNPNRQTIEQYANNGGFAKYGVKGNPQAQQSAPSAGGQGSPPQMVKVTAPDGKSTGSVPANRLQDYLNNGYKQAQ